MGSRLPSVLQYDPHYDVDHAVPALARGVGRPRYMHVTGKQRRDCASTGHHICGFRLYIRRVSNIRIVASADRLQDQDGTLGADVSGLHHWRMLFGSHSPQQSGITT